MNEISSVIDKDAIINKLSRIPDTVVDFQIELGKDQNVFGKLVKLGIDYKDEKRFKKMYLLEEEGEFILPKKKSNWKVICEYLGIDNTDKNQAWISHYGRKHINEIKGIYRHIFNLCIDGEYLSGIDNPELINKVANYLEEKKAIFEEGEGTNTMDLAKSIISAIINELSFHQVKEIKTN
ncbi:MAG: hypothetical protein IPJ32_19495 [Sphingobacteriaceae bacterium]|nr:hypothetical protein [Sphingobacteriaceae bacterium]